MEIRYFDEISSTHTILCDAIRDKSISSPVAIYAGIQNSGIGSRGNSWEGKPGNLFLSFCLPCESLPNELPPSSTSIYFAWQILEFLRSWGSKVWLKWPNDLYIEDKKIGGVITTKIDDFIIVSVGMNLKETKNEYGVLDIALLPNEFVNNFIPTLKNLPSWKHIFSKYKLEFSFSRKFFVHIDGKEVSLCDAKLCEDGSIEVENKKVYSLR